jgi:hypothetical protein
VSDVFHHQDTKSTKVTKRNFSRLNPRENLLGALGVLGALVLKLVKEGLV